jgi:outer membrane protein TolC
LNWYQGLFDETILILQSPQTMRLLRILLVLASAGSVVVAQTNATPEARKLSLQDCIQLALQHNLELQIDRYNPQISLFNLKANYGDYDPNFSLSGQHDHNESGSQLVAGGLVIPGSITDDNSFSSTLNGLLPWGTTYSFGTGRPISDTYGTTGGTAPDPSRPFLTTNGTAFVNGSTGPVVITNFAQVPVRVPFENSAGAVSLSANQPLLKNFLFNQTKLNIHVAKNRLQYSELTLRLQIMQTITKLEQAYYDLIYNRENLLVQQKAVELAERLVAENRKRLEVGALAPLDLQSAEAQAASTRAAVIQAQSVLGTQERLVKQLITDKYRAEWADVRLEPTGVLTAPAPVINLQDSWSKGLSQRPELLQSKLDVERVGIQLKYDRNQLLPELDAFATYGFNGSGTGRQNEFSDALYDIQQLDRPFYTYGGKISIPLSNTKARNNYKADKASREQVVLTLKQLEQNIMIQIDNDIGTVRASYDQVQATRAAREYEEAALDAEQKKLESGKSTTYTVLQVQRDLTNARGNEIQALDSYNRNLSQLSLDEGSTLERLGVNLEVK